MPTQRKLRGIISNGGLANCECTVTLYNRVQLLLITHINATNVKLHVQAEHYDNNNGRKCSCLTSLATHRGEAQIAGQCNVLNKFRIWRKGMFR